MRDILVRGEGQYGHILAAIPLGQIQEFREHLPGSGTRGTVQEHHTHPSLLLSDELSRLRPMNLVIDLVRDRQYGRVEPAQQLGRA